MLLVTKNDEERRKESENRQKGWVVQVENSEYKSSRFCTKFNKLIEDRVVSKLGERFQLSFQLFQS